MPKPQRVEVPAEAFCELSKKLAKVTPSDEEMQCERHKRGRASEVWDGTNLRFGLLPRAGDSA